MKITVFAKKCTTREGKPFPRYLATLKRKDGTEITVSVKFRDECGAPKPEKCPMNIQFPKTAANLATNEYVREDTGELAKSHTLWINQWSEGEAYVDRSLDDFE